MIPPDDGRIAPGVVLAVVGLKREARLLAAPAIRTVVGGGDAAGLTAKLRQALQKGQVAGVISVGLGGALSRAVRVGDWVVGDTVVDDRDTWPTDPAWRAVICARLIRAGAGADPSLFPAPLHGSEHERGLGRRIYVGSVAGSRMMVVDRIGKIALHDATGALAVDMESQIAARFASAHSLPFASLRVISDGTDRDLPKAAQAGMKPDGGMDIAAVLRSLARDPRQLPALIRTGREAEVAFRALALLGRHDLLGRPRIGELDLGELGLDVT